MLLVVATAKSDVTESLLGDVSACPVLLAVAGGISLACTPLVDAAKLSLVGSLLAVAISSLVAMATDIVDVAMPTSLIGASLLDCRVVSSTDVVAALVTSLKCSPVT